MKKTRILFAVLMILMPAGLRADEVTDAIDQAKEHYNQKQYTESVNYLNHAEALIGQKQTESIGATAFPAPLKGWEVEDAQGAVAKQAFFGGGSVTSRLYKKDKMEVEMAIVANSPMVSSMIMLMNNSMAAVSSPKLKSVMIKGERGLLNTQRSSHELSVILDNQILVTFKGKNLSDDNFLNLYAQQVDYKAVRASVHA